MHLLARLCAHLMLGAVLLVGTTDTTTEVPCHTDAECEATTDLEVFEDGSAVRTHDGEVVETYGDGTYAWPVR